MIATSLLKLFLTILTNGAESVIKQIVLVFDPTADIAAPIICLETASVVEIWTIRDDR
jgi:hypothetical protein